MNNILKNIVLAVLATALTSASACAATILYSNQLPTENIFLENNTDVGTYDSAVYNKSSTFHRSAGVTFIASDHVNLNSITFYIHNNIAVSNASIRIDIYNTASKILAPGSGASPLYSDSGTVGKYSNQSYITFDFGTGFELIKDSSYAVVISFVDQGSNITMNLKQAGTTQTGNVGVYLATADDGANWTIAKNSPPNFVMTATAIPEPGSQALTLVGIAVGGLLGRRFIKR